MQLILMKDMFSGGGLKAKIQSAAFQISVIPLYIHSPLLLCEEF